MSCQASSCGLLRTDRGTQDPEDAPGQIAFDATSDLFVGLALGAVFLDVVARLGVVGHPADRGNVQGAVEPPVATLFGRWRTVLPDDPGMGFTPARQAKAASLRTRPSCDQATKHFAAVTARNECLTVWGPAILRVGTQGSGHREILV